VLLLRRQLLRQQLYPVRTQLLHVFAILLYLVVLLIVGAYGACQCTPILMNIFSSILGMPVNILEWTDVTVTVQLFTGVATIPAFLFTVYIMFATCCKWKSWVRKTREGAAKGKYGFFWSRVPDSVAAKLSWWKSFRQSGSPNSEYFLWFHAFTEAQELIFQALAVNQFSMGGTSSVEILIYTFIIFCNGTISP
jgi:hypothetical protein